MQVHGSSTGPGKGEGKSRGGAMALWDASLLRFVRAASRRFAGDGAEAEDLAQDALVVALDRGPRDASSLRAWLWVVIRHRAMAGGQRRRWVTGSPLPSEAHARPGDGPEAIYEHRELRSSLLASLEGLEAKDREIIRIRILEGRPSREAARALGIPNETGRTRLRRALARLRERVS